MFSKGLFPRGKGSKGVIVWEWVNSLPDDKILLDFSKLKTFAGDKINVTEKLKFAFGRLENLVGKKENLGYHDFLLSPQCFQKATFPGSLKVGIVR